MACGHKNCKHLSRQNRRACDNSQQQSRLNGFGPKFNQLGKGSRGWWIVEVLKKAGQSKQCSGQRRGLRAGFRQKYRCCSLRPGSGSHVPELDHLALQAGKLGQQRAACKRTCVCSCMQGAAIPAGLQQTGRPAGLQQSAPHPTSSRAAAKTGQVHVQQGTRAPHLLQSPQRTCHSVSCHPFGCPHPLGACRTPSEPSYHRTAYPRL